MESSLALLGLLVPEPSYGYDLKLTWDRFFGVRRPMAFGQVYATLARLIRDGYIVALGEAVRSHWAIENSLHWVLDVTFNEDKARSRTGHGPANMATVRHFAFNILKAVNDKRSLKLRRNKAARNNDYMAQIVGAAR